MAKNSNKKTFTFCGYKFNSCAQGGRLIHPDKPDRWYDPLCVDKTANGLELFAMPHPNTIKYWDNRIFNPIYGVGMACSQTGFSYGRYEFVAKLPYGKYMYPAIWLSGVNSWPPEIDIFEGYNTKTRKKYVEWPGKVGNPLLPSYTVETNVHYKTPTDVKMDIKGFGCLTSIMKNPTKSFITYVLDWKHDSITISYNGHIVRQVTDKDILAFFNKDPLMNVIMSMDLYNISENAEVPNSKFIIKSFKYTPYL